MQAKTHNRGSEQWQITGRDYKKTARGCGGTTVVGTDAFHLGVLLDVRRRELSKGLQMSCMLQRPSVSGHCKLRPVLFVAKDSGPRRPIVPVATHIGRWERSEQTSWKIGQDKIQQKEQNSQSRERCGSSNCVKQRQVLRIYEQSLCSSMCKKKKTEQVQLIVVCIWRKYIMFPLRQLRTQCVCLSHQRVVVFVDSAAAPVQTYAAIWPGSKFI